MPLTNLTAPVDRPDRPDPLSRATTEFLCTFFLLFCFLVSHDKHRRGVVRHTLRQQSESHKLNFERASVQRQFYLLARAEI